MSPHTRPLLAFALLGLVWAWRGVPDQQASSRGASLAELLSRSGLSTSAEDVVWLDEPGGPLGSLRAKTRALVRARAPKETFDLYLVQTRLSPEGALLGIGGVYDLTRTTGVDEERPTVHGDRAAYVTSIDGAPNAVHVLSLSGRAMPTDFTSLQRAQFAITNAQSTGQESGIRHDVYTLERAPAHVGLSWGSGDDLLVATDDTRTTVDAKSAQVTSSGGDAVLRAAPEQGAARPASLVPWAVDRVRAIPWFGEEKMQWVKAIAFKAKELVTDAKSRVSQDTGAEEAATDMNALKSAGGTITFTDPEIGWPPAPMKPTISPALAGEGEWIGLDKDPFITQTPGAPPAFLTSFIRTDPKRLATRIYVTIWDPRQIALHMEAGTVEPVGAAGEAGPGVIPRTPEIMRRVVAGFNGGFQALHGEFGMQANGIEYLPPKPYAATVMEMKDGSTAFGAWPKAAEVPDEILSYRQNLTALVQNDKFNPWGRAWWGGTPIGWYDNIHTTRSGVCLTKENYVAYFYGIDIAPNVLADGMLAARCAFGVHLDMNPGLAGFEFYNVQPRSSFVPLGRPLQSEWEYEGTIKELPEFLFRARRMMKSMQHQNFPQYIHRDGRDFFYLTARYVLPGADVPAPSPRAPDEGKFRVKGLPQHGFPYALAIAESRLPSAPDVRVRVVRVDPRAVTARRKEDTQGKPVVLTVGRVPQKEAAREDGDLGLFHTGHVFIVGKQGTPPEDALLIARGTSEMSASAAHASAAVGVGDEDGMLQWVELAPGATPSAASARAMGELLTSLGCTSHMWLIAGTRAALGGTLDTAGQMFAPPSPEAVLVRADAPGAHPYFSDTPIVGQDVWQPLQSLRVRYYKKPGAPGSAAPAASTPPPGGTASTSPGAGQPAPPAPTPATTGTPGGRGGAH